MPPTRAKVDLQNHGVLIYDLSAWTADDRAALGSLLRGSSAVYQWNGSDLVVAQASKVAAEELIATFDAPMEPAIGALPQRRPDPGTSALRRLGSLSRKRRAPSAELAMVLSSLDGQVVELQLLPRGGPPLFVKSLNHQLGVLDAGRIADGAVSIEVEGRRAQAVMLIDIGWVTGPDGVRHGPY